jgi:LytR cell envelope-related transcriptional attenuator
VESSYVPTIDAARWRTATIVACGVAALELVLLVGIGITVLGRSVAHRVQDAAIAKVADVPAIPKETPPGKPKLSRRETDVLVLNGSGSAGAAGTAADGLRARGYQITAVGNAREQSGSVRTLVMYRRGYRAEAARLASDVRARIVAPLDGMRRSALMGAQVVLVVGR